MSNFVNCKCGNDNYIINMNNVKYLFLCLCLGLSISNISYSYINCQKVRASGINEFERCCDDSTGICCYVQKDIVRPDKILQMSGCATNQEYLLKQIKEMNEEIKRIKNGVDSIDRKTKF